MILNSHSKFYCGKNQASNYRKFINAKNLSQVSITFFYTEYWQNYSFRVKIILFKFGQQWTGSLRPMVTNRQPLNIGSRAAHHITYWWPQLQSIRSIQRASIGLKMESSYQSCYEKLSFFMRRWQYSGWFVGLIARLWFCDPDTRVQDTCMTPVPTYYRLGMLTVMKTWLNIEVIDYFLWLEQI